MKLKLFALAALFCATLSAHSVLLTWQHADPSTFWFNIYRTATACKSSPTPVIPLPAGSPWTPISSVAVGVLTFTDLYVADGSTYCYFATAFALTGVESEPSNLAEAVIPANTIPVTVPVSNLVTTVK